jgi:hypothetical protein
VRAEHPHAKLVTVDEAERVCSQWQAATNLNAGLVSP